MRKEWIIPVAAALFVGGVALTPAQAADLGGDCCADLEERVAELEATTVRKGNRKVSVKVSGFVSKSVMFWDDGTDDNVYVGDTNGGTLSSNISITGSAEIGRGWSAGYDIVIEVPGGANLTAVSQDDDDAGGGISTLVSSMWIKSENYGKLSWGKQSQASDNAALLPDLSGTIIQSNYVYTFHGGSFRLRQNGLLLTPAAFRVGATWSSLTPCATSSGNGGGAAGSQGNGGISQDCNGGVLDNVRYDSPTIAGFTVSTSWGEDDFWDVAINYAGTLGDFKIKAAYAYTNMTDQDNFETDFDVDLHQVGASFLHMPTGIFAYGAYTTEDVDEAGTIEYTDNAWYVKAGIQLKLSSLGKTVIYGEYGYVESKEFLGAFNLPDQDFAEFRRYGVGIVQYVDAAALQLHAMWKRNEGEVFEAAVSPGDDFTNGAVGDVDDLDMFIVGGTIFY